MKWFALSLCMIGVLADLSLSAPSVIVAEKPNYRLNDDVWPTEYTIEVTPYFDDKTPGKKAFTFDGVCTIKLKATKSNIKEIVLHVDDLMITKKEMKNQPDFFAPFPWNIESLKIDTSGPDEITKKYTIKLEKALEKNKIYDLYFEYTGNLQTDMHGFYRSSYKDGEKIKWLASTQMEPVHARKVFPCFDEPRFKAVFNIIINRPAQFHPSVSNTPQAASYMASTDRVKEIFEPTPVMSSYLVAFIVSEFDCRETKNSDFGVCSRPNAYGQTEYSFHEGQKILAAYDKLFDYKYSTQMKKMTMAAIPDFAAGAMENWGLLTYRETALLYEPTVSTSMAQQRIASVVAHEQAHMWFGDLVTCDWWSDTWLNEGFARFYEYFGTAMVEDTWGLDQQFTVDQVQSVFGEDSLESSLPLSYDVNTPEEIQDRFGSISYAKGGSVIRMFKHALGEKTFNTAIQKYLKANALQTGLPEKLFAAFQKEVDKDVDGPKYDIADVMHSWIFKAGYPLITVEVDSERKTATISQKRFLRNKPEHDDKTLWKVPITFATNQKNADFDSTLPNAILDKESMQIDFGEPIDWVILNVQQTGYYRVNYDDKTWSAIANGLQNSHEKIHVLNRAQIVDDTLNLARANQLDYVKALNTVNYLAKETEYVPWKAAFNNFDFVLARFTLEEAHIFEEHILSLIHHVYEHLGFEPKDSDSRLDIYNRMNVLKYACKFGHEQCIKDAREEYDQFVNEKGHIIPVDLVPVVYCSVVTQGNETEWNYLWKKFESENVAAEQVTILGALGCTKNEDLIKKYFELILSDDIRLQDKHAALVSTMTHQQNLDLVADFVIEKHSEMDKAFEDPAEVATILSQLASRATTQESIDKIEKFADGHKLGSNKGLAVAIENARMNLKWAEKNIPTIKDFVKKNGATTLTVSCITAFMSLIIVYLLQ